MQRKYTNCTDKELVKLLGGSKSESEAAFAEIYDRYSRRIFAYIIRILNNRDKAEDVFQETFIKFFNNVNAESMTSSLIGFLITIARNLCLNIKRDKRIILSLDDFNDLTSEYNADNSNELEELVKASIELLDFEYREPLVLRVYDGLDYTEIAEICGISAGNARQRVHRAREKLKSALTPYLKEMC